MKKIQMELGHAISLATLSSRIAFFVAQAQNVTIVTRTRNTRQVSSRTASEYPFPRARLTCVSDAQEDAPSAIVPSAPTLKAHQHVKFATRGTT